MLEIIAEILKDLDNPLGVILFLVAVFALFVIVSKAI